MGDCIFDKYKDFPLLLKIISAEKLSIQVHPGEKDFLDLKESPKKKPGMLWKLKWVPI